MTGGGGANNPCLLIAVDRRDKFLIGGGKARARPPNVYAGKCLKPLRGSLSGRPRSTATRSSSPRPGRKRDQRRVLLRAAPSSLTARHQQEQQRSAVGAPSEGRASLPRASERRRREVYDKANRKPRKRLGYRTPYEIIAQRRYI